jgi:N-acyl-D-amino-acid deacylase
MRLPAAILLIVSLGAAACRQRYDVIIRGGEVHDGTGAAPRPADIGIRGDRIVRIGKLAGPAELEIDARGLAVAPGFINVLSWSNESLIADGRSQGEVRQGVTTQVLGEGHSMGPLTEEMRKRMVEGQRDIRYAVEWTTLAGYLEHLEQKGIAQNVASFIGAATLRECAIGLEDREPSAAELELMRRLAGEEMRAGALGIASSLIYAPGSYARTAELVELAKVAAEHGGMYISHLRSEGDRLIEAVEELLEISLRAGIRAEIYHLKAAGEGNWSKMDRVIEMVEEARSAGLEITADMYTYTAGATGLDACIPLWARDGGPEAMRRRFRDPETRRRIAQEILTPSPEWENLLLAAGSAERVLLTGFKKEELKRLQGKTLAEAARLRGRDVPETIMDLMLEDESRVGAVYFMMSEENVRKQLALPWVSFGSDSASMAVEGVFLKSSTHPRAYGNFARLLGKYVREEKVIPLAEAIRRLTDLPARNLRLEGRGRLEEGFFADIAVFDPETIADRATYENPHQYAVGVRHVLVNGTPVLRDGEPTGALPGRALKRGGGGSAR